MVLESLIFSNKLPNKTKVFFAGFIFSSIAVLFSLWIFKEFASLSIVFLTVLAAFPFIYSTIRTQEKEDLGDLPEQTILKDHIKTLNLFMFLFFGIVTSFAIWYVALPSSMTNFLFQTQASTIVNINSRVSGAAITSARILSTIFFNNLKVMIFCILFSFIYGAGAIFILTWNASVISTAIGNFIRSNLSSYALHTGISKVGAYFHVFSLGLLRYAIHGIPEIFAYFTAGMAGGIISVAAINHNFHSKKFSKIVLDSSDLILISLFLLFLSALLEVYVTPLFFG